MGNNYIRIMFILCIFFILGSFTVVGATPNVTLNYPLSGATNVELNPILDFTVLDDDLDLINVSTFKRESNLCYQETANVSTSCGGLDTGSYKTHHMYFYINYTKPDLAYNGIWQVKHGILPSYNISISENCWLNSSILQLRFRTDTVELPSYCFVFSQPQCLSNTWNDIGTTSTDNSDFCGTFGSIDTKYLFYDGNWSTYTFYHDSIFTSSELKAPEVYGHIYEEAIWWNIYNYSELQSNISISNGTDIKYQWTDLEEKTTYFWCINVTDGINSYDNCNTWNFTTGAIPNVTLNYPLSGAINIKLNPILDFTVFDDDLDLMNVSIYQKNNYSFCYQETANVSTACGGLDNGTYYSTSYNIYINYTKPLGTSNLSVWKVKAGIFEGNLTIPNTCFAQNILQFKLYSKDATFASSSSGYCYNGSQWLHLETFGSGCSGGATAYCNENIGINNIYDGNWTFFGAYLHSSSCWSDASVCAGSRLYEEAMWWKFDNISSYNLLQLNTSISNGTDITYQWFDLEDSLEYFWCINITDGINTYDNCNTWNFTTGNYTPIINDVYITPEYPNDNTNLYCNFNITTFVNNSNASITWFKSTDNISWSNINTYDYTFYNITSNESYTTGIENITLCYQEFANESSACGGLDSGSYIYVYSGSSSHSPELITDGNWDSYANGNMKATSYINYSKPNNALISSVWKVKSATHGIVNYTIPSYCFLQPTIQFKIFIDDDYIIGDIRNLSCYNGTAWYAIEECYGSLNCDIIYEEAMWWNITIKGGTVTESLDNYSYWKCQVSTNPSANSSITRIYPLENLSVYEPLNNTLSNESINVLFRVTDYDGGIKCNLNVNDLNIYDYHFEENATSVKEDGIWWSAPSYNDARYAYDNNYSTHAEGNGEGILYLNYSITGNATYESLWEIKYGYINGNPSIYNYTNLTIPLSCFDNNKYQLQIISNGSSPPPITKWSCWDYNINNWLLLMEHSNSWYVYEEGIWFREGINVTNNQNTTISYTPLTDGDYNWNISCIANGNSIPLYSNTSLFIYDATPPIINYLNITPFYPKDNDSLSCWFNISIDQETDVSLTWFKSTDNITWSNVDSYDYTFYDVISDEMYRTYISNITWIYQEFANETKNEFIVDSIYAVDGNWSTYGYGGFPGNPLYVNYTKIENSVGALWQEKNSKIGVSGNITNITIPSYCWDYNSNKIILKVVSYSLDFVEWSKWYCYDGSWNLLNEGHQGIWEEAIWWDIHNISKGGSVSQPLDNYTNWICQINTSDFTELTQNTSQVNLYPLENLSVYEPLNNTLSNESLSVLFSVVDYDGGIECNLNVNGSIVNSSNVSNNINSTLSYTPLTDGDYRWNISCNATGNPIPIESELRLFIYDATPPIINYLNITPFYPKDNDSLSCWFNITTDQETDVSLTWFKSTDNITWSNVDSYDYTFYDIVSDEMYRTSLPEYYGMCYQEYVNVSTACGGLNTGTVDFKYIGTGGTEWNYYFNYTIPENATNQHLWEVKYHTDQGTCSVQHKNLTIPNNCLNGNILELLYTTNEAAPSSFEGFFCKNNTEWQQLSSDITWSCSIYLGSNITDERDYCIDGNWSTWCIPRSSTLIVGSPDGYDGPKNLYEEAIWWNLSTGSSVTDINDYDNWKCQINTSDFTSLTLNSSQVNVYPLENLSVYEPIINFTSNESLSVLFSVIDYDGGIECNLNVNGNTVNGSNVSNNVNTTLTYTPSTDGDYIWNISCNATGNPIPIESELKLFTYETLPPNFANYNDNSNSFFPEINDTIMLNVSIYDSNEIDMCFFEVNWTGNFETNNSYLINNDEYNLSINYTIPATLTKNNSNITWRVRCNDTVGNMNVSEIQIFTVVDSTDPIIIFGNNNGFNIDNTTVTSSALYNLTLNITFSDPNLFQAMINISCGIDNEIFYWEILDINDVVYTYYNDSINLTGYKPQKCKIYISSSDDHTANKIPKYIKSETNNGLLFKTENDINVEILSLDDINNINNIKTKKLDDRYKFEFDFNEKKLKQTFIVKSDKIIYPRFDSKYPGHLLVWNPKTKSGNWIDFKTSESDMYNYKIERISDKEYKVHIEAKILNKNLKSKKKGLFGLFGNVMSQKELELDKYGIDNFEFESIGGTNVNNQTYIWNIGGIINVSSFNIVNNVSFTNFNLTITNLNATPGLSGTFNIPGTSEIIENLSIGNYSFLFTNSQFFDQTYHIMQENASQWINYSTYQSIVNIQAQNIKTLSYLLNLNITIHNDTTTYKQFINDSINTITTFYLNADTYNLFIETANYIDVNTTFNVTYKENITIPEQMSFLATFYLFDEKTENEFNISSPDSIEFLLFCPDNTTRYNINETNTSIVINCNYINFRFVLWYGVENYYRTFILSPSEALDVNIFLIDFATTQEVKVSFKLEDLTKDFDNPSLYINKLIGTNLEQIHADYTELEEKVLTFLIQNDEYILELHSDNHPVRALGKYIADSSGTKLVYLYDIELIGHGYDFNNVSYIMQKVVRDVNGTNETYAVLSYSDLDNLTTSLLFTITKGSFNGTIVEQIPATSFPTVIEINISGYPDDRIYGTLEFVYNGTQYAYYKMLNDAMQIAMDIFDYISNDFRLWFFILLLSVIAIMATIKSGNVMSIVLVGFAVLFKIFGWFSISGGILAIAGLFALIALLKSGEDKEQ